MNLYDEFFAIIEAFESHDISYAVIGGIAMAFYAQPRFTKDIDILINTTQKRQCENILSKLNFFKSTDPHPFLNTNLILHRFVKAENDSYIIVDLLVGKGKKVDTVLENTVKTEWEKGYAAIASKKHLIQLKKLRNSDLDKIDIKKLSDDEEKNKD